MELSTIQLPVKPGSLAPGDYELQLELTHKNTGDKRGVELQISVQPHEILRSGIMIFIKETQDFIISVTGATATFFCKNSKSEMALIGFPEPVISACICKETLFVLSRSGLLHGYCLENLSRQTFRLANAMLETDVVRSSEKNWLLWDSADGNSYGFEYRQGCLTFIGKEKVSPLQEKDKIISSWENGMKFCYETGASYILVEKNKEQKRFDLEGTPPSLAIFVPGDCNRKPAFWMEQGVSLVVYEWNGMSLDEILCQSVRPSYALRCREDFLYFAHQKMIGVDINTSFNEKGPTVRPLTEDLSLVSYCSTLNINSDIYAVGDSNGCLNLWKMGYDALQIQAHDAVSCLNYDDGTINTDCFVSDACWIDEEHIASVGIDKHLKCFKVMIKKNTLSAELVWHKELFSGVQSMMKAGQHLVLAATDSVLWLDPADGETISKWDSSEVIMDPILYTSNQDLIVGDWNGHIHFFKKGKKIRSHKICDDVIFAIEEISRQYIFVVTEAMEGFLINVADHCAVAGRCHYRLKFGERNAKDVIRRTPEPSIVCHQRVHNIVSHEAVFSYPWDCMCLENGNLHFSNLMRDWDLLKQLV